jgi:AcrR family transcriptional regulator
MNPSLRVLRALADEISAPPYRTRRQNDRHDRILTITEVIMARYGCHGVTFRALAVALRMATVTLINHFVDRDAICGEILRLHLRRIADAIGNIPQEAENRRALQRQAYLAVTRTPAGGLTNAHLILTRDRHFLPLDELDSIEDMRRTVAELLAEPGAPHILDMLDTPWLAPHQIEAAITLLAPAIPAPELIQDPAFSQAAATQSAAEPPAAPEPAPATIIPAAATPVPQFEDSWGDGITTFGNTPPEWNIRRRPPHQWPATSPDPDQIPPPQEIMQPAPPGRHAAQAP